MTMIATMRRAAILGGVALAALGLSSAAFAQKTKLTVYTALENDQLEPVQEGLRGRESRTSRSPGCATRPASSPRADPGREGQPARRRRSGAWRPRASRCSSSMGMLEAYTPKGADALKPAFKSGKSPTTWIGMDAWLAVICFNTVEGGKKNRCPSRPAGPTSPSPSYKDSIVMPNPASSGTGYLTVAALAAASWARTRAGSSWTRCTRTSPSTPHSGSAPCVQAAKGERVIGIGFDMRGATREDQGRADRPRSCPRKALGWDMEATAIVKGTKNLDAAKKLADWAVDQEANELYGKYYAIVGHPGRRSRRRRTIRPTPRS